MGTPKAILPGQVAFVANLFGVIDTSINARIESLLAP